METSLLAQPGLSFDWLSAAGVLDSLPDGLYITDRERRILFWNAAAERITGWKSVEVVGRSCFANILVHIDKDGHALCGHEHCPLHRSIMLGSRSEAPVLVFAQHKDGRRIPVEVSVAPVRNGDGEIIGGVESFRDLTASQEDLLRARRVQERALNCRLPQDPRFHFDALYQPSDLVGGDFYHIERVGTSDTYSIFLADVVGHGVAAALNTMLLRALWDEHRDLLASPSALLAKLNGYLHELAKGTGYFGTAVAITYDAASGEVRCARAGHPAPLWFHSASGMFESVGASDPGLGLLPDAEYYEVPFALEPGDYLLLASDGAEEAPVPSGGELGVEGVIRLLQDLHHRNPGKLNLQAFEESLLRRAGTVRLPDDLTLLVVERALGPGNV